MKIWGGNDDRSAGFTIVEVLVVLAVTAAMLVMAVTLVSGKQSRTEFAVSSRVLRSKIQTAINEAASGYYPSTQYISCSIVDRYLYMGPEVRKSAKDKRGSNTECMYAGNALVFGPSYGPHPHITNIGVFPLAGQSFSFSLPVNDIYDSNAQAIAPRNVDDGTFADLSYTIALPGGMQYVGAKTIMNGTETFVDPSDRPFALVATNLNGARIFTNDTVQNARLLALRLVSNPTYNDWGKLANNGDKAIAEWINWERPQAFYGPPAGYEPFPRAKNTQLCFASGTTDQSVLYIAPDGGAELSYTIVSGKTCGWVIP